MEWYTNDVLERNTNIDHNNQHNAGKLVAFCIFTLLLIIIYLTDIHTYQPNCIDVYGITQQCKQARKEQQ